MSSAEDIAKLLDANAKQSGSGWMCRCPCHDDKKASLGIIDGEDGPVFNCLAGCDWKDIKAHVSGLYNMPSNNGNKHPQIISYKYFDQDKKLVAEKIRHPVKRFEIKKHIDKPWPIYNLSNVINAEIIYITEGEKDADNLIRAGLVATTNIAGASHWDNSQNVYLTNKTVIICQDNDRAGRDRTAKLLASLKDICNAIYLFEPPGVAEKGDVSDWLSEGNDASKIFSLSKVLLSPRVKPLNAADWLEQPENPAIPILDNIFDAGDKVVIIGQSKTRKSFFAQQLAFCLASGKEFLNFSTIKPRKVLLIQFEIKKDRYHTRCIKMLHGLAMNAFDLSNLEILNARGHEGSLIFLIKQQALEVKPEVIIIDPLYKLIDGDESKIEEMKPILREFDQLAESSGAAVVYIHHDKKGLAGEQQLTDRGAGSGVLARDFDSAIFLSPQKDQENTLVVEFVTRNNAPQAAIAVNWRDYHFSLCDASTEKQTAKNQLNKRQKLESVMIIAKSVVEKLSQAEKQGIGVALFVSKLEDAGITARNANLAKNVLLEDGVFSLIKQKAKTGSPCKILRFMGWQESIKTVFEREKEDGFECVF